MLQRLLKRGVSSGRNDDNVESIKKRFSTYRDQTMPVIKFYDQQNKVVRIVANKSVDEVWKEVNKAFESRGFK